MHVFSCAFSRYPHEEITFVVGKQRPARLFRFCPARSRRPIGAGGHDSGPHCAGHQGDTACGGTFGGGYCHL